MLLFNKAFNEKGVLNPEINRDDCLGEEIVYSTPVASQIEYLSEVSEWLSTMVDFIGGPILSGALLAQIISILSGGKLTSFSISKPDGLYGSMCHMGDSKGFHRAYRKEHDGKIAIVDDVLYQGRTLSHSIKVLHGQIEAIVVFRLVSCYDIYDLPENLRKYSDKIWVIQRDG